MVVVDVVDAAALRFLGPTDGFKATLRWCHGVRGVREWPAAREKRRWSFSPVMRPWRNPGVGATRSGAKELEDDPEVEAEPVHSLDGAQVRQESGGSEALRGGARCGAAAARVCGGRCGWEVGCGRGPGHV